MLIHKEVRRIPVQGFARTGFWWWNNKVELPRHVSFLRKENFILETYKLQNQRKQVTTRRYEIQRKTVKFVSSQMTTTTSYETPWPAPIQSSAVKNMCARVRVCVCVCVLSIIRELWRADIRPELEIDHLVHMSRCIQSVWTWRRKEEDLSDIY